MKRAIITPAPLSAQALDELKQWLAITGAREDAALDALLRASLDMCEAFTGAAPLEIEAEEVLPATREWQALSTRPIGAIVSAEGVLANGQRVPLMPTDFQTDIAADGMGHVRLRMPGEARRIAVRFTAGLAPEWDALPRSLRHGIVRLAAHHYHERDHGRSGEPSPAPPAAVTALWQPWRRMRLI